MQKSTGPKTGCTIEGRTVRPERVAAYIVGVAAVGIGTVAAAAARVLVVAAAWVVDDADPDVHIAGAVGKAVLVTGFVGDGTSARRAAAHDVAAVGRT